MVCQPLPYLGMETDDWMSNHSSVEVGCNLSLHKTSMRNLYEATLKAQVLIDRKVRISVMVQSSVRFDVCIKLQSTYFIFRDKLTSDSDTTPLKVEILL